MEVKNTKNENKLNRSQIEDQEKEQKGKIKRT